MAKKAKDKEKQIKRTDEGFSQVEQALTKSEQFIERNQTILLRILCVIIVLLAIFFGYKKWVYEPKVEEASNQIYMAERYFEADSFNLALNGDGNALGFIDIASRYSSTPSGKLANLYMGICYLKLGEFESAIKYLEKYSSKDMLLNNMATANCGDAYMELGDFEKAAKMYNKAASSKGNDLTTPYFIFKEGFALMQAEDYEGAIKAFERIQKEYPDYADDIQVQIEKYIAKAKGLLAE